MIVKEARETAIYTILSFPKRWEVNMGNEKNARFSEVLCSTLIDRWQKTPTWQPSMPRV
jgi:hypothetical protein